MVSARFTVIYRTGFWSSCSLITYGKGTEPSSVNTKTIDKYFCVGSSLVTLAGINGCKMAVTALTKIKINIMFKHIMSHTDCFHTFVAFLK